MKNKQLGVNYRWGLDISKFKILLNNILKRVEKLEKIIFQNWILNSKQIITDDLIDLYPNSTYNYTVDYPDGIGIHNVLTFGYEIINDKTVYLPEQLGEFSVNFSNNGIIFTLKTNDLTGFLGSGTHIGATQVEFICTSFSNIN